MTVPKKIHHDVNFPCFAFLNWTLAVGHWPTKYRTSYPLFRQLEQLYTVAQIAQAMGRHPISVYKAILDLISMPIQKFIGMGRSIRFVGIDVAAVSKPKRGRPRKVAVKPKLQTWGCRIRTTRALPASRRLAWLNFVVDALPVTRNARYESARRARAPWLHLLDPYGGKSTKFWAIDHDGLVLDYRRRGKRLNEKYRAGVDAAAVPTNPAWFASRTMEAVKN
jgi:hypothetical protein